MSAPAAELEDLYGGMEEDVVVAAAPAGQPADNSTKHQQQPEKAAVAAAAAQPPAPPKRKRTQAELAAEAAAEAERSARARLTPAAPVTAAREVELIREGDYAVFDVNGEKMSIQHVRGVSTVKIGRSYVSMAPIIGTPYGSVFRLQNRAAAGGGKGGKGGGGNGRAKACLVRVARHASVMGGEGWAAEAAEEAAADEAAARPHTGAAAGGGEAAADKQRADPAKNGGGAAEDASAAATRSVVGLETRNNARLFDLGEANQALTAGDVHALKLSAREGGEVIAALCAASATFGAKTAFAQAKYKRRKAKKHAAELCVRRATGRTLAHAMFESRGAAKMLALRPDTAAIALSLANVGAHARVLVMEAPALAGLLAATAAERLGGKGLVCAASFFPGQRGGPLDAVRHMNFTPEERAAVCSATLDELREAQRVVAGGGAAAAATAATAGAATAPAAAAAAGDGDGDGAAAAAAAPPRHDPKAQRLRSLLRAGFTGAILADPRLEPCDLLAAALPLLPHSTPFCVFHPSAQPLADAHAALAASRSAVMLRVAESWTRPYQVLPGRTHPHMACNGSGGYLLSGVTAGAEAVYGAGVGKGAALAAAAAGPTTTTAAPAPPIV